MDFEADYKFLEVKMGSGLLSIVSREVWWDHNLKNIPGKIIDPSCECGTICFILVFPKLSLGQRCVDFQYFPSR